MGVHMGEAAQCSATSPSLPISDAITDPEKSLLCLTLGLSSGELGEDLWRPAPREPYGFGMRCCRVGDGIPRRKWSALHGMM